MLRSLLYGCLLLAMVASGCGDDDDDAATRGADFDVVFDGQVCTVSGPESLPAGDYTFVLTDTSEVGMDLLVSTYSEGRTYDDARDYLEAAGGDGTRVDRPAWASPALRSFDRPALDLAEHQTQFGYFLEAGSYGISVETNRAGVWGCGGFDVT